MNDLFPPSFLAAIGRLSVAVRAVPARAAVGAHLSPRPGASLEFRDHQPYAPGDDLRRVDWSVYGRTRHLFVRRFERPTAIPVFVLVDASASMRVETPSRFSAAARVAAAVASAAIAGQSPVRLLIAGDGAGESRVITGRSGLVRALSELGADRPATTNGIAEAIFAVLPTLAAKGPGVLAVISDFFEPRGVRALTDALRLAPQRLVLVRVTQPTDADPVLDADVELEDCETAVRLHVRTDAASLRRYGQAYAEYFATLDAFASARGARQVDVDASGEIVAQLERLFPAGVLAL